jgi:hypothetical protein
MVAMGAGEAIAWTIGLFLVAATTAGLWLNLLMWIPMLVIGWTVRDEDVAFGIVSTLSMLMAAAAVILVGLALNLPWYAAAIAGVLVGITSYARPNPAHPASTF